MSDDVLAHDAGLTADTGSRPADPMIGSTLKGTYQVVRKIAEGGMGVVYEGEHVRLKRRVAIKVLLSQYARHPEVIARFRREAEIVGGLGHPHIVQVFDVDETEKKDPFLVMEYLDGETLADRLEHEPRVPLATAVRIAVQVASALTSTHDKEIVHRDLKPENVFLVKVTGEKEFAKVLDFGISKVRGGGPRLTQQNMVIGTPAYMAPEQARGERELDHRVDQFALAAITYEMLAGQSPFPGEDPVEIMTRVIAASPVPLAEVAPWVPAAVAGIVARGMAKQPAERFPTIADYARELEHAVTGAEIATTLPPEERRTATAPPAGAYRVNAASEPVPATAAQGERSTPERARVAAREAPTRQAPSSPPEKPPLIASGRTPPPIAPEHRVEHAGPKARAPSISLAPPPIAPEHRVEHAGPMSRRMSRPSLTPVSHPKHPVPVREQAEVPLSVPPFERISRIPSSPPSGPQSGRARVATPSASSDPNVLRAQEALEAARAAVKLGRLDDAVRHAEHMLELAVFGKDAAVYEVLRAGMPVVDHIFEARLGPLDRRLEVTAVARDPKQLNLSSKAAFVLSCAENGASIQAVIDASGIPRRDVIRMLAGLMRRGALVAH